ncbi:imelysin family protein [Thiofilum flexile]|uniref:imelysin family protein n=1 Tax=Thiofilum flexile TaxID=125627 RepID=UPI00037D31E4|nr:imelysin family protein [Thiofilum flexile]
MKLTLPLLTGLLIVSLAHLAKADEPISTTTTSATTAVVTPASTTPTLAVSDAEIRDLLTAMTDKVILPTYQALETNTQKLVTTSQAFCTKPDVAGFKALREVWSVALNTWQEADAFNIGPAIEDQFDFNFYFRPIKKSLVNGLLKGTEPITPELLKKNGVGVQGFAALEYLLFDREKTEEAQLKTFDNNKRCEYLNAASTLLHTHSATLLKAWTPHFSDAMKEVGKGSTEFVTAAEAFNLVINRIYQAAENAKLKIQPALGQPAFQAGLDPQREQVKPYQLEAWRSGHTLANTQATLIGVEKMLVDGGLLAWLKQQNKTALADEFAGIFQRIKALSFPSTDLFAQLEARDFKAADALFNEAQMLTRYYKQRLAPALGVSLGFNANDGD